VYIDDRQIGGMPTWAEIRQLLLGPTESKKEGEK